MGGLLNVTLRCNVSGIIYNYNRCLSAVFNEAKVSSCRSRDHHV